MTLRTMSMIWGDARPGAKAPCAACGRELNVKGKRWYVHVIDGGSSVLHPDHEATYETDDGEMGFQPVGPECRKKFGTFAVETKW